MDVLAHHGDASGGVPLSLLAFSHAESGLLYEVSAPEILATYTWRGVQALALGAMTTLHLRTRRDASFWFEPVEAKNPAGQQDLVLRLWFVLDEGAGTEVDEAAVRRALRGSEARLASRGKQPISEAALPSLVLVGQEIHQAWLLDPPDVVAPFLVWNDRTDELEILGARRDHIEDADLLTCSRHALLICPDDSILRT